MVSPVKTAVQDIRRLREISGVLTGHGFSAVARRAGLGRFLGDSGGADVVEFEDDGDLLGGDRSEAAVRFRNVLEDLGPTFVKLGQVLSTRPDILPPEFIDELKNLQDRVPALSFEQVREQVESNLDGAIEELFEEFQEKPLAAASIGQAHRAVLPSGRAVVVKVQRPGISEKIRSDLDILYYLARFLEATIEEVELYTPTAIVREFERAILNELDFLQEAQNIEEFGNNFAEMPTVEVPEVEHEYTTSQILTMEFIDADKLASLEGGSERAIRVLDTLLEAMVKMVLYDGFFHGDPHPGNIMVREDDTIVFIDFGLVGRLSESQQDDLIDLILTILTGDVDGVSRSLLSMGYPVGRVNLREFKADITRIRNKYLAMNLGDIEVGEFVQETMNAAQKHRIRINTNYAVLTKAAMTIEGIMRELEPDMDIMKKGMPYAKKLATRRFSARKVMQGVMNSAMGFSGFVQQIPQQMDQILMDLEGGNLTITIKNESIDEIGTFLNTLGTRLFLGIIAAGLAVAAALILRGYDYMISGVSVMMIVGILLAIIALALFWWALSWHIVGGSASSKLRLEPFMRLFRKK
ncbi:AarF/ABC1/UbiB kinase family protein [Persicimonas caeni]|uniref:AarF/ABC1/UbiB kinase family protein n=1 Tax=Persicimonas caeni TaxID=2292766 RepID=A0A4Y6PR61_PERCE|nr:AarF/ABC1/UbiB kinase family protein [Persicimonas caeni]QDG50806.1 AarF/ABC1/UbiB kinase family protein [Persicimonas caeni]QED32027.1 AarF/ABC1/UbiB kinase family protein [Persicimonas caeni]